jgi:hypothetical protein
MRHDWDTSKKAYMLMRRKRNLQCARRTKAKERKEREKGTSEGSIKNCRHFKPRHRLKKRK